MHLPGQAHMPPAAVAEDLYAGGRDPDRIRVVAVGREAASAEPHLGPLDPGGAGAEADPFARSF